VAMFWFFFFFQAEDGIRDYKVTGVQTCALPIFMIEALREGLPTLVSACDAASGERHARESRETFAQSFDHARGWRGFESFVVVEIGRASCRERVEVGEGEGQRNQKEEPCRQEAH